MSNNRNNRYNKKTKTSPQTKTSLLVNDEDSSSSERFSQRKEGTAQAAAREAALAAAREEAAREEAARRSREEAARRGEGAGIGVPAGYDSSAERIRAREEMAERIRAREEMAKRIIGREEEAAKLAAEINADIQAGVVETTRMQQFRSIRGDTVICVARQIPLWALKFLLRSINYFLIAVNKPKSDVTKAIWDSAKGAIKRFLNYVHQQVVSVTDPEIMELFGRIKENLKIEDSSLTMSICDNGLTLAKVIKDLFIEGIISVSIDAYDNFKFILESLETKADKMSEEEQSTATVLLTLGVNSDEAADMAAEDYTQEEIREAESQGSSQLTQKEGGKRHTRKHKKQNKSRKQMKHKKTKRHRKKTKKHLKKRNNKKQRKTRNRK